jgi:hypothetical protein
MRMHYKSGSNLAENDPSSSYDNILVYNKRSRRQALLEIRRLLVDFGMSHQEIQLQLNLPERTYFRYLDILFKAEQEAIQGNNYTYNRLLNETLILQQRYLRRARMLTEIANDKNIDAEQRIEAHSAAGEFERAAHDMAYMSPSYLKAQGLLPADKKDYSCPHLRMSKINNDEEKTKDEKDIILTAGEIRRQNIEKQQQQRG